MGVKLTLSGVSKTWPGFSLKDVNLEIDSGEYFVLLGPTGAGKTLLLESIMGFHALDSGKILLDDQDITETKPSERRIGYVPQIPSLSSEMTVRENIEYGLRKELRVEKYKRAVDGIMEMMGIADVSDRLALTLSGGEKRKVSLSRALIMEPPAILLDEPLGSIDEENKRELQDDLRLIHKYLNLTVIHVTHDQVEAYNLAERMGLMKEGLIIQVGTPSDIYANPKNATVARFIGYENIYAAKSLASFEDYIKLEIGPHTIKATGKILGDKMLAAVRNDDVEFAYNYFSGLNDNTFLGTVSEVLNLGPIVTVTADIGIPIKSTVLKRQYSELPVEPGDRVWFRFNADAVKLIPDTDPDLDGPR